MKRLSSYSLWFAALFLPTLICLSACNSKDETDPGTYTPVASVAINSFSLQADASVMKDLDSIFFSIDLEHGVVYNADSLPKGTDVKKLVANISFPSTVTSAIVEMTGGSHRTGSFDYKSNSSDTIDFTGNVTITLSADNNLSKSYKLKVNVHKQVPDSMIWDAKPFDHLSVSYTPAEQKTLKSDKGIVSFIKTSDGSYVVSSTTAMVGGTRTSSPLSIPFSPIVRTFSFCNGKFYILADDNTLYESSDAITWNPTSEKWHSIIGAYGNTLLGIAYANGVYTHVSYPADRNYGLEIDPDFPISGFSNFATFSSEWSDEDTGFFVGGVSATGKLSDATWAYDGSNWSEISSNPLPALKDASIVPYFIYNGTSITKPKKEYSILLAYGGITASGEINQTVYLSYDNGVNWFKAASAMQLPSFIKPLAFADFIVDSIEKNFNLSDAWKSRKIAKVAYQVDGGIVNWACPYIYIFGGLDSDNKFNNDIYRGVLTRLACPPLF